VAAVATVVILIDLAAGAAVVDISAVSVNLNDASAAVVYVSTVVATLIDVIVVAFSVVGYSW
jgi:hypothetical protein